MHTYVWGWSRSQRLRGQNQTLTAKDEKTARRMIREQYNLRTTRGLSLVSQLTHDYEMERRNAARYAEWPREGAREERGE